LVCEEKSKEKGVRKKRKDVKGKETEKDAPPIHFLWVLSTMLKYNSDINSRSKKKGERDMEGGEREREKEKEKRKREKKVREKKVRER
jgi:hypothetical protein